MDNIPSGPILPKKVSSNLTLPGISELAVADWDADGKPEIFVLSADERQLGVTRLDENGRIGFPRMIPIEGRPLVFAVGKHGRDARAALSVIVEQDSKKKLIMREADGATRSQDLSKEFKSNPSEMLLHDIDQDGAGDLVVLIPYQKIKLLRSVEGASGNFDELDIAPPGGSIEQPWASVMDVDGDNKPELMLAQKNFLRAVTLEGQSGVKGGEKKASWTFQVKEQINGATSRSRIVGAANFRPKGAKGPLLFLLDADQKALSLCERDKSGVWQVARNLPLPVFEFSALRDVKIGPDAEAAIALQGVNSVAITRFSGRTWEIEELDSYETPIKNGFLMDVVTGDLNQDKTKDLVFIESAKNHLDIVKYAKPHKLVPANRWKVFEERTFRSRRGGGPEPREALIADLNGDGRNDLAIIVHDRILLYTQE